MSVISPYMKQISPLPELQIASKIKAGKDFLVADVKSRRRALVAAKYLGVKITTRADGDKFHIIFL